MGSYQKGILGPFSGKIGAVIGSKWKGINYMRSRPSKSTKPPTLQQEEQRSRFAMIMALLAQILNLLKLTFPTHGRNLSGFNIAMAHNVKEAITGIYPGLVLDYSKLLLAKGSLTNADAPTASSAVAGKVAFAWTDNSGNGTAAPADKSVLVVYCPVLSTWAYTVLGAERAAETDTINVPQFSGKQVHTWIAFRSASGDAATSLYTGAVTVL